MDLLNVLEERGALRRGHTVFRNGRHADGWTEKGDVFRDPAALDAVAAAQAASLRAAFPDTTLLVGAPACGAVLASFVGRHLGLPVAYVLTGPHPGWHRMNLPAPGQQAVYVDDLICTGTDARAVLAFLRRAGHTVSGVSAWLSRTPLAGERLVTLSGAPFQTSAAEACPLCRAGVEVAFRDVRE
ncbi:orotate phosphoribosyltransferase [Deinococcus phoenicis]|uniref:Orotate phosphoribosyltransferase n=1 Tax=Deinococcus phoenicis TaxID=1476583 RepID=A0A016QRE4_9DEIO|nr:orotate phosphoribosyltransferase [Deinococcus phoenicis]EYB68359.1 orotate phosphoribosyltransferase [Deinococcus phoenicis]